MSYLRTNLAELDQQLLKMIGECGKNHTQEQSFVKNDINDSKLYIHLW